MWKFYQWCHSSTVPKTWNEFWFYINAKVIKVSSTGNSNMGAKTTCQLFLNVEFYLTMPKSCNLNWLKKNEQAYKGQFTVSLMNPSFFSVFTPFHYVPGQRSFQLHMAGHFCCHQSQNLCGFPLLPHSSHWSPHYHQEQLRQGPRGASPHFSPQWSGPQVQR